MAAVLLLILPSALFAASPTSTQTSESLPGHFSLSSQQWHLIDDSVDRGLKWLASQQQPDGSFACEDPNGQPGVTGLCLLAFLSRGYTADQGPYTKNVQRTIDSILSCRQPDGLICLVPPLPKFMPYKASHTGAYTHAIGGLALTEAFGLGGNYREKDMRETIEKAIHFTLEFQKRPKRRPAEEGGWRYLSISHEAESDISVTSWHLMFLRSARNAGFTVPSQAVEDALGYVERSFLPSGGVVYNLAEKLPMSPAIIGAGVLSFSLAGRHHSELALRGADRIVSLRMPRDFISKRFSYKCFYCTQAMFQVGEPYWSKFFTPLIDTLTTRQNPDGSWPEDNESDRRWGQTYSSAMGILCLTPPYHMLPIFQR